MELSLDLACEKCPLRDLSNTTFWDGQFPSKDAGNSQGGFLNSQLPVLLSRQNFTVLLQYSVQFRWITNKGGDRTPPKRFNCSILRGCLTGFQRCPAASPKCRHSRKPPSVRFAVLGSGIGSRSRLTAVWLLPLPTPMTFWRAGSGLKWSEQRNLQWRKVGVHATIGDRP